MVKVCTSQRLAFANREMRRTGVGRRAKERQGGIQMTSKRAKCRVLVAWAPLVRKPGTIERKNVVEWGRERYRALKK
jgi:hypothetical protein